MTVRDRAYRSLRVSAVISARNEERNLTRVLGALRKQTLPLHQIVVVNDGSTDRTPEIAKELATEVLDLPYHEEDFSATLKLGQRFNARLAKLTPCDYVLIVGADDFLPSHYVQTIVERMETNPYLVVASGTLRGEPSVETAVRGSGRLVKTWFWKTVNSLFQEEHREISLLH